MKHVLSIAAIVILASAPVFAIPLLTPGDFIIAIDSDGNSSYPDGEPPANAIDGTLAKYLNFGRENSGFIVTPSIGPSIIESFQITTANDDERRDPVLFWLSGTNDAIISTDNSNGAAETWTTIAIDWITLPSDRNTAGPIVTIANQTEFASYKLQFISIKDLGTNSMQIAEIQFFGTPEPASLLLLGLGGLMLRRRSA